MTPFQVIRAQALERCSLLPASADKRFIRDMAFRPRQAPPPSLTERQALHLERLAWKYRRQLDRSLVPTVRPD